MRRTTRIRAAMLTIAGLLPTILIGGTGVSGATPAPPTWTDMSCSSANPLLWAPPFTWGIRAGTGESLPPGGNALEPALLLSGYTDLPTPPPGLIPFIGPNWYGNRVLVDWRNLSTGASGRSVSEETAWRQNADVPINRTFTGTGTIAFTVTLHTGAGWWFVNPQNAVCQGQISVVPGGGWG